MYYAEWNWAGSHTNAMNERNSQTDPNCGWIYYLNTIAADDSQHVYNKETPYKSQGFVLTDKLSGERLDRVLEFFNWCATDEASEILSWGEEGLTYTVNTDGTKSYTDLIKDFDTTTAPAVSLNAYTRFHQDFIPNRNVDAVIAVSGPVNIELGDSFQAQGYGYFKPLNFLFDTDTQEEVNMLKTLLNDTMTDYSNKFVMGMMDPNSDADWEAYLSALDGCGLQEWNQYYTDYYNANLK
jgi:putative aldouronate transport system substrate-binding protein